ncbi:hypothetical protein Hypma_006841 [Hypsizygus marmoreus]|uniref:Uncharacterized protein n=1 Tax=Hypsizygus marmoreus TaxID=39966 RepID=A0A369K2X3_HYPMA|nr:hypothetical protein Hypma_006841 [Hypsizygus marmoreus]
MLTTGVFDLGSSIDFFTPTMQLIAVQFAACTRDVDVLQWVVDPGLTETTLSPHCGLSGATLRGNISPKSIHTLQSVRAGDWGDRDHDERTPTNQLLAASPNELCSHGARTTLGELTTNGWASLDDIICQLENVPSDITLGTTDIPASGTPSFVASSAS